MTGTVRVAPPAGAFLGGTHMLTDPRGSVMLLLRSDTVNLTALDGLPATVCGHMQSTVGQATGVQRVLIVTAAQPLATARFRPTSAGCG